MENKFERGFERIPTKEEILEIIGRHSENYIVERELSDEQGIYLLEVSVQDPKTGNRTEYCYVRKGRYAGNCEASETEIHAIFYDGDTPKSGVKISTFITESGQWKDEKR